MSVKFCTVGFQLFSGKTSLYIYDTQLASLGSSLLPTAWVQWGLGTFASWLCQASLARKDR